MNEQSGTPLKNDECDYRKCRVSGAIVVETTDSALVFCGHHAREIFRDKMDDTKAYWIESGHTFTKETFWGPPTPQESVDTEYEVSEDDDEDETEETEETDE